MDLSGIIFAALAVGWAVYLIPKALQHHDDIARTRAVSTFSGRLRVLGSGRATVTPVTVVPAASSAGRATPSGEAAPVEVAPVAPRITREGARRAARRRRRVLLALVFALGTVSGLTAFAIAPLWAPAVPGGLILVFLVVARLSVRRQARRQVVASSEAILSPAVERGAEVPDEDTQGIDVSEVRADAAAGPALEQDPPAQPSLVDDGSLWDPLPLTLPTYVTKPTARRTVRTIELTRGAVTSSGHSAADSKLVQQAEAARKAQQESEAETTEAAERKAAGA